MNNSKILPDCNGWSKMYSSVTVIGATEEQVLSKIHGVDDWDYVFYNWEQPSDKCIRFDAYRECPEDLVIMFSAIGADVICYASTHWDNSYFCVAKGGDAYENYTAEWIDDTPSECDDPDDCWDCTVQITDKHSGVKVIVGGGACEEEDYFNYQRIIDTHRV